MTTTLSLEARRDIARAQIIELQETGRFPARGVAAATPQGGNSYAVRRFLETAGPAQVDAVLRELGELEDLANAAERRETEEAEREEAQARKAEPLSDQEYEQVNSDLIDSAARAAERASTPMSAEQGDQMLSLLRDIAARLEKREGL